MTEKKNLKFDLQRFRDDEDVTYRGRRRWSGNYGMIWLNNSKVFEHKSFEAKVVFEREDVWIGHSKDSKVTGLSGEGEIVIVNVFNRGFSEYLEEQKKGHDPRFTIVAKHSDPDMLNAGKERIKISNVTFDELVLMQFEKGSVRETTIPFKFTPEDASYLEIVDI